MLGSFNPLEGWWKMSSYSKWYHYFWLMPIVAVFWLFLYTKSKIFR